MLRRTRTSSSHTKKRTSQHWVTTTINGLGYISGKSWRHCFKGQGLAILATTNQHPRAHDPKPFSWAKLAYIWFSSSNFTVQDRIPSTFGDALTSGPGALWKVECGLRRAGSARYACSVLALPKPAQFTPLSDTKRSVRSEHTRF